jgi:BlaI family transcriptional regulator, penicillinase repressor
MARKHESLNPTDGELEILAILWRIGPATVRQVHEQLLRQKPVGYTTALKLMQIMTEKNIVRRDERTRPHVYTAENSERSQRELIEGLADRAFEGSVGDLVLRALSTKRATQADLAKIRKILDNMES